MPTWSDVIMNTYGTPAITLVSGSGAEVTDSEGRTHIDLLAGIAVNALGHGHPAVVQAVSEQIATLGHVSNLYASQPVIDVAAGLIDRFGDPDARVFFCNSGTEANEAAFKIARATGRSRILAAEHGFHGRTMGALALTGQPDKRKKFEPMPAGVEYYTYGDIESFPPLDDDVAAIFLEPIQGETGVVPAPDGFLAQVRQLCDEHGILMICDEVQTGVGRTGEFFAFQHDNVRPDVVTMAKGLGGGLPMGACIATGKAAKLLQPGDHGCTFGGNPVTCAAARVVLDVVDKQFLAEVTRKGELLRQELLKLPQVESVRGRGLMLGVVLREPVAKQAVAEAPNYGILINAPQPDVVRLTPPLIISDDQITQAVARFADLLKGVSHDDY